jgi:hypothetical protein
VTARPILFSAPMVRALLAGTKTQTRRIIKPQPSLPVPRPLKHAAKHPGPYFDSYCSEKKTDDNPRGMSADWCWWTADDRPDPLSTIKCPYGAPGDKLWVKESHALIWPGDGPPEDIRDNRVEYRADTDGVARPGEWPVDCNDTTRPRWRPSIHMHRWASRITLEVTNVRVERLHDITEDDAKAEGVDGPSGRTWPEGFGSWSHKGELIVGRPWAHKYLQLWMEINGHESAHANPLVWVVMFRRTELEKRAAC